MNSLPHTPGRKYLLQPPEIVELLNLINDASDFTRLVFQNSHLTDTQDTTDQPCPNVKKREFKCVYNRKINVKFLFNIRRIIGFFRSAETLPLLKSSSIGTLSVQK